MMEFAEANGMSVRGHTLVWEQATIDATPDYVTAITDPQELRTLMADHILTVVGRYRGRIDAWDVVNEPLAVLGAELDPDSLFFQTLGPGYIAEVFELAHQADPQAKLFLNEVLVEGQPGKAAGLVTLVSDLLAHLHATGKGGVTTRTEDGSAEHTGVLRRAVPQWLRTPEFSALVVGFEVAGQGHGGSGAFYVRLRRQSKGLRS